jgi:membrane-associated phospholipid phosphatase
MSVLTEQLRIDQPTGPTIAVILPAAQQRAYRAYADQLANAVSTVLSPPVLAAAMIAIAAAASHLAVAWIWAVVALTLCLLAPMGYLLWLFRRGVVSDLDVQQREERARPLAGTLAAMFTAVVILRVASAPPALLAVTGAQLAQTALVLIITLRWKISVHGAAVAACVALLLYVVGHQAALALLALPLVGWSRVRLHRHTPAQTVAGALLGGLVTGAALVLATGL